MMDTQVRQIRAHLLSGMHITPMEALGLFGCFRLSARIYDLKETGMEIEKTMIRSKGKYFAQYRLKAMPEAERRQKNQNYDTY